MIADNIFDSLVDSGKITKMQMLKMAHEAGVLDVAKLLAEAVSNFKERIANATTAEKRKALAELREYLDLYESLLPEDDYKEVIGGEDDIAEVVEAKTEAVAVRI